jgi:hypothetical protein
MISLPLRVLLLSSILSLLTLFLGDSGFAMDHSMGMDGPCEEHARPAETVNVERCCCAVSNCSISSFLNQTTQDSKRCCSMVFCNSRQAADTVLLGTKSQQFKIAPSHCLIADTTNQFSTAADGIIAGGGRPPPIHRTTPKYLRFCTLLI